MNETTARPDLPLPVLRRGKVRDVYDLGDALLMVATDRLSAFDVILSQPVPRKGEVLNLISAWWFAQTTDIVPNHLITVDPDAIIERYPQLAESRPRWERRAMLVRKLQPFPVECVVRGYISGSAWVEYSTSGTLAGEPLAPGLVESSILEKPIFSPATKAEEGHDENITFAQAAAVIGEETAEILRSASLRIYERGREIAEQRGLIIADTKFEFGQDPDGVVHLIDEVMTPDSSRFWPADDFQPGRSQKSFDKQPVRDYLQGLTDEGRWDKQPPPPDLPDEQVQQTIDRYRDAFRRLTGVDLDDVPLEEWGAS